MDVERPGVERVEAGECESCGLSMWEEAGPALYECGSCGEVFNRDNSADGDSARCPQCNKFAAKIADESCPQCEEAELVGPTDAWGCPTCNDLYLSVEEARSCCPDGVKKDGGGQKKAKTETTKWGRAYLTREDTWLMSGRQTDTDLFWRGIVVKESDERWVWEIAFVGQGPEASKHGEALSMAAAMMEVEGQMGVCNVGVEE